MPLVPGASPQIRQVPPTEEESTREPINVIVAETEGDAPEFDDKGNIVKITHADGEITVSLDGRPLNDNNDTDKPDKWFANLCDKIEPSELSRIAEDLLRGIEEDMDSRREWIDDRATCIRLLGLKIETPNTQGAADGAPVEGMSRTRHPLMQEAVLRFQANARSEFLPTDGPAKVRVDGVLSGDDSLANALERDLNHYLTTVAKEYYPDTDRMLLMLGLGGTAFKKVYFCPLRQRPVSESVDADDLIVNDSATDLANASRVTHRSHLKRSTVRRLQILGVYRDIELHDPKEPELDAVQRQKLDQQGITQSSKRPDNRDREIYECYCELDVLGYEHKIKGEETGLEIPYRVTIDVSTKEILSIVRDYDEDTKALPEKRTTFVKFAFVPGFGFYDIGLGNILGNTTNALTAAWRELLDAGMFANFPGGLIAKAGTRQQTNVIRPPPGGFAPIETGGMPIAQTVMALPYKEPSQALMNLVTEMSQTGQRVGGTAELQVGEGSANAPVGTTLTLVEQATKVMNSVHKRLHAAQAEELQLLVGCFREHPKSFWERNKKPAYSWDEKTFIQALEDYDLVPQSDPNTASFGQRVLKFFGLAQRAAQNPTLYDPIAVERAILTKVLQFGNPEEYMAPPSAMAKPPPELLEMQAKSQAETTKAQAAMLTAQARMIDAKNGKSGLAGSLGQEPESPIDQRVKLMEAVTRAKKVANDHQNNLLDARDKERQFQQDTINDRTKLAVEAMSDKRAQALDHAHHQDQMALEREKMQHDRAEGDMARAFEHQRASQEAMMGHAERQEDRAHEAQRFEAERADKTQERREQIKHEAAQAKAQARMKAKPDGAK